MTESLPTCASRLSLSVLAALMLIWNGAGCRLPGGAAIGPHLQGRWTGRVVPVTVYDGFGTAYEAAALEVIDGPPAYSKRLPGSNASFLERIRSRLGPGQGSGRIPLLVKEEGVPPVIPVGELPVGKIVSVRGLMMVYSALAPRGSFRGDVTVSRVRHRGPPQESEERHEHILSVRSTLEILGE